MGGALGKDPGITSSISPCQLPLLPNTENRLGAPTPLVPLSGSWDGPGPPSWAGSFYVCISHSWAVVPTPRMLSVTTAHSRTWTPWASPLDAAPTGAENGVQKAERRPTEMSAPALGILSICLFSLSDTETNF